MKMFDLKEWTLLKTYWEQLPDYALRFGARVLLAIVTLLICRWFIKLIRKLMKKALAKGKAEVGVVQFLDSFMNIGLTIVVIFLVVTSFGVDAATVVALLGSAGVALGLALQGSLSNLAGGVLILLLRPFRVGDYIIEDSKKNEGTVQEIHMFYTKLVTPDDKVIVLPNGTLANTSLTNVTGTTKRRLDLRVGIAYDSDIVLAKQVLLAMLASEERLLDDMEKSVLVVDLKDSSIELSVRAWASNDDYWPVRFHLLEQIVMVLQEAKIKIPYPQMEVHWEQSPSR